MKTYSVNSILKNNSSLDLRLTFLEINEVDKLRINFDSQLKKAAKLSGIYPELPDYSSSVAASLLSKTALDSIGGNLNSQIGAAASSFDSFLKDYPSANIASLMDKAALDNVRNTISHFETAMTDRIAEIFHPLVQLLYCRKLH